MNFLKKGPEIKLSSLKVPDFLVDLYWDLRDRHLLPLAAILVVALIAAPFVLGDSSDPEAGGEGGTGGATSSGVAGKTGALVATSTPGLREYRKRLEEQAARDPFKQRFRGNGSSASGGGGDASSTGSAEFSETGSTTFSESESTTQVSEKLTYFSFAIDVRVVPGGSQDGGDSAGEATVRRNLPELTMLPSRETPAIIYMGSTRDGKKALMLISSDVEAIFGDAKCVLGSQTCELLALEPGVPETFVYGGAGRTYKIELLKIHLVATDKLNKAPLGKPKKGKGGNRPALRAVVQPR